MAYKRKAMMPTRYARPATRRRLFAPTRVKVRRTAIRTVRGAFAKRVKAVMNSTLEKKFLFVGQSAGPVIAGTPLVQGNISIVPQGITDNTRVGEVITPTSMELNYMYTNTTAFDTYVRVSVIKATKTQLTGDYAIATSQWYNNQSTGDPAIYTGLGLDPWKAFTAKFHPTAVTVCHETVFKLARVTETDGSSTKMHRKIIPLKGKINYNGAAGGALLQTVRYFIHTQVFSPGGTATSVAITAHGYAKLRFTDA